MPAIPLIPVSSSQAVIGAVLGIGLVRGKKTLRLIRWRSVAGVASGWVSTPIMGAIVCYFALFFVQNVFGQTVYRPVHYEISEDATRRLQDEGVDRESRPGPRP